MRKFLFIFLTVILLSFQLGEANVKSSSIETDASHLTPILPLTNGEIIVKYLNSEQSTYTYEAVNLQLLRNIFPELPKDPLKVKSGMTLSIHQKQFQMHSIFQHYENAREMIVVQPNYLRYASAAELKNSPISWGTTRSGLIDMHKGLSLPNNNIIVAVVDSGVDVTHPMLSNRIVAGYDFIDDKLNHQSFHIHGTHVSGIIIDGTPEQVKVMPIRVLGDDGYGSDFDIARGIIYAVQHGAHIINLSLGAVEYSVMMDEAINYALSQNVLVVAAAGNESDDTAHYFPAMKEEIIVVSATTPDDDLAYFSNYGDSVDVSAPGVNIFSALPGNEYGTLSGTSMAAPLVSAAAALFKLQLPSSSPADIERAIRTYSDDMGQPGWDRAFGEGIMQLGGYVKKEVPFQLISPLSLLTRSDHISIKYYSSGLIGKQAIIKLGDRIISGKSIHSNGFHTETVNLEGISEGTYELSVEIIDQGQLMAREQQMVRIVTYNTEFEAYDMNNNKVENFHIELYGIKKNISFGLEWIYTKNDGLARTNLDFEELNRKYDNIIAIVNNRDNLDMPVYIREVMTPGKKILQPENMQFVEFSYDLPDMGKGIYGSNLLVSVDGVRAISTNAKSFELGSTAKLYIDRGMHQIMMNSYSFRGDFVLEGTGTTTLSLNRSNTAVVHTQGPQGINPSSNGVNRGGFDDDIATVSFQPLNAIEHSQSGTLLNVGQNTAYVRENKYRVIFNRSIKKYDQHQEYRISKDLYLYRDIEIKSGNTYEFMFGGSLNVDVQYDYTRSLSGFLNIQDQYGNSLIANLRAYFYQFGPPTVEELAYWSNSSRSSLYQALEQPMSEITFENPEVVLKPTTGGNELRTPIDGQNGFRFNGHVPDGHYTLYVDDLFDSEFDTEYPLMNNQITVTVKDGQFVHTFKENSPPKAVKSDELKKVMQYDRLSLDLNTLFTDADRDDLYFETSHGYIYDGTLYYDADKLGIHPILIRASDRIAGTAQYQLELTVWDGKIEITEVDDVRVFLNGKLQIYEQPAIMESGRVMVPFRAILEALGAAIEWNPETRTIKAYGNGREIELVIGQSEAYVNRNKMTLDVPAKVISGRTLVPLRFIGEAFGAKVKWDPVLNSVYIDY